MLIHFHIEAFTFFDNLDYEQSDGNYINFKIMYLLFLFVIYIFSGRSNPETSCSLSEHRISSNYLIGCTFSKH